MNFEPKDIIRIDLPRILGDPPARLSFELSSNSIDLAVLSNRIYNSTKTEIINNENDRVTLRCTDESVILLHSDFREMQNIYWYPFVSSQFNIDSLQITNTKAPWLEISTPNNYKSLTKLSSVNHGEKRFEKWTADSGTYYFPLKEGINSITMTFKANGANIYDGLVHLLLPVLLVSLGTILSSAELSDAIRNNTTAIIMAVLLSLTPLFVSNFKRFLEGSFMSITLGLFLYLHSYAISVIYIIVFWFLPAYTSAIAAYILTWLLIMFVNTLSYFRKGTFNRVFTNLIFKPILYIIRTPYLSAWKIKKK